MSLERARSIREIWDALEADEPNISTEQLAQRVAKMCRCSTDAVFDALYATKDERNRISDPA